MLLNLHVKNLALIEEAEVYFDSGLNILTGETGAGKSILIGSINLALGAKASNDMIRQGEEYGLVELVFSIENEQVVNCMKELELPMDGEQIVISRKLLNHRSISKVNGETVTAANLRKLTGLLMDIHGQNEHQALLYKAKHLEILDEFSNQEMQQLLLQFREEYQKQKEIEKRLETFQMDEEEKNRTISFYEYEVAEIEEAQLTFGEDEKLEEEYKQAQYAGKILSALEEAHYYMSQSEQSVENGIGIAVKNLAEIKEYSNDLEAIYKQVMDVEALCVDISRDISAYRQHQVVDEEKMYELEKRLNLINHLKSKYGNTIEKILEYQADKQQELEKLYDYDKQKNTLTKQLKQQNEQVLKLCEKLSKKRKENAVLLEKQVIETLRTLNFLEVRFQVQIKEKEEISITGKDDVEFLISTNPGEKVKPLAKVASGGELSRIMLGLKTILSDRDLVDSVIFDEVDAGISGKTAQMVAEKLNQIAGNRQVICITHLPQIAAMADYHYLIEKTVKNEHTITQIRRLREEESIEELSRLLGGNKVTQAVKDNANELKRMAKKEKRRKKDTHE